MSEKCEKKTIIALIHTKKKQLFPLTQKKSYLYMVN